MLSTLSSQLPSLQEIWWTMEQAESMPEKQVTDTVFWWKGLQDPVLKHLYQHFINKEEGSDGYNSTWITVRTKFRCCRWVQCCFHWTFIQAPNSWSLVNSKMNYLLSPSFHRVSYCHVHWPTITGTQRSALHPGMAQIMELISILGLST